MSITSKVYRSFITPQEHRKVITHLYQSEEGKEQSLATSVCSSLNQDVSVDSVEVEAGRKTDRDGEKTSNVEIIKQSSVRREGLTPDIQIICPQPKQ